jgi:hypothetical protein
MVFSILLSSKYFIIVDGLIKTKQKVGVAILCLKSLSWEQALLLQRHFHLCTRDYAFAEAISKC